MSTFADRLKVISDCGNLRRIPPHNASDGLIDLTTNDYLGLAADPSLQERFFDIPKNRKWAMTASASRLLGTDQQAFNEFEELLFDAYGKPALLFNSGYHANTGIIPALADSHTLIIADKLVHASIIDGIILSRRPFLRFRHNDIAHLTQLIEREEIKGENEHLLVIVESVYSMDGDSPNMDALAEIKKQHPKVILYIDEAHAVGVSGPRGLGLAKGSMYFEDIDVIVGTLGKALASAGAYAIMSEEIKQLMINTSRSLIFSTALSPMQVAWSTFIFKEMMKMDDKRKHLMSLAKALDINASHIYPVIVGNPFRAVSLSAKIKEQGFNVLPIRTPTVPKGTDRLRISLSASLTDTRIYEFKDVLSNALG